MVQTMQRLTSATRGTIGNLLFEILQCEITEETRSAVITIGDLEQIPEPYHHLLSFAQGASADGKELANLLLEELRDICAELQEKQR